MRWVRFAVFVCVVTLLQVSVLEAFAVTPLQIKPDLLLILLVFFAVYRSAREVIVASFAIGFAADLSAGVMGPYTISFGVFGTALVYLCRVVVIRRMGYQGLVIFLIGLLSGLLAHILSLFKVQPATAHIFAAVFWTSVYSGFVGPFLFLPCAWWMRIKTRRYARK